MDDRPTAETVAPIPRVAANEGFDVADARKRLFAGVAHDVEVLVKLEQGGRVGDGEFPKLQAFTVQDDRRMLHRSGFQFPFG